jgi:hypothetical protein
MRGKISERLFVPPAKEFSRISSKAQSRRPGPHDVVEAPHGSAVTYKIRDGRMIPKSAK